MGKCILVKEKVCIDDFGVDSGLIRLAIEKLFIFFSHLGLRCSLTFTCKKYKHTIQINTSKMILDTKHRDINIRVQLGTSVSDSIRESYLSHPDQF